MQAMTPLEGPMTLLEGRWDGRPLHMTSGGGAGQAWLGPDCTGGRGRRAASLRHRAPRTQAAVACVWVRVAHCAEHLAQQLWRRSRGSADDPNCTVGKQAPDRILVRTVSLDDEAKEKLTQVTSSARKLCREIANNAKALEHNHK